MSDENNNNNNEIQEQNDTEKTNSKVNVFKFVLIIVAIFLGTFAAVYTVVDVAMYRLGFQPFKIIADEITKSSYDEFKYMNTSSSSPVKIETKNHGYVVTINMSAFGDDENNFDIEVKENGIKIKGMYFVDKKTEKRENTFYQNVIFPEIIDENGVTKEIHGKKMVITIPFKEAK